MKLRNVTRFTAAAVLLAGAGGALAGTGHQWGDYHWTDSTGSPITLKLSHKFADYPGRDGYAIWGSYYERAVADWENGSSIGDPLNFSSTSGEANHTTAQACAPITGEVVVCSYKYGTSEGWVGIAEIDISGTSILWATAKFNDSYYEPDSPYAGTYNTPAQRAFVACHEVGHTFGLGHLDTAFYNKNLGSCMDYTADPDGGGRRNPDNRYPGTVDWEVLNSPTMYGDYSGGGKKGVGGRGGPNRLDPFAFRDVGAAPAQPSAAYGRFGLIRGYDDEGRPVEFTRRMPNGHTRLTFVTWAKGVRPQGSRNQ